MTCEGWCSHPGIPPWLKRRKASALVGMDQGKGRTTRGVPLVLDVSSAHTHRITIAPVVPTGNGEYLTVRET